LLILIVVLFIPGTVVLVLALATSGKRYPDSFIDMRNPDGRFVTATPARRLAGNILDGLIAGVSFYVGWLVWLAIVAPRGQSPGKALVGTYVIRADGTVAGAGYVWLREFFVKGIAIFLIAIVTAGIGWILSPVGAMWCLWDKDKQCLWDKVVSTYVAYAPGDTRPVVRSQSSNVAVADDLTRLKELLDRGLITPDEYEERRVRLVARL